ncbi:hypothetical protein [Streptomyces sp. NPDC051310]|uniref:hypothetical protein n=1 Tax=Streptomyces sp. NPDC051310 TaxID=3365649 RepID=UPI00379358F2
MSAHSLPQVTLLLAFGVTAGLAWLAAARRRGAPFITAGLLALQAVLHVTFGAGRSHQGHGHSHGRPHPATGMLHPAHGAAPPAGHHTAPPATAAGADAAHDGASGLVLSLLDAVGLGGASAGMLAVHLLAAAVCALWLARGEAAFFRLARAVGALAFTPLRLLLDAVLLPDAPRPPRAGRPRAARRHHGVVLAHSLSRRGPPATAVPRATVPGAAHV